MKKSVFLYYFKSIFTLLRGVRNPGVLVQLAFHKDGQDLTRIQLRSGTVFKVFSLMDAWVIKETMLDRQYEFAGVPLHDGWTVLDIGAALGDYTVWAAGQVPDGRVIAVEPYPPSVATLRENLALNQVSNVEIFQGAISAKNGVSNLHVDANRAVQNTTSQLAGQRQQVEVKTITLQNLLDLFSVQCVDYLKMDCEGGEYEIIFSAPAVTLARVERICMEVHDGLTEYVRGDMVRFLQERGFQTRLTPNPVHDHLAFLYAEKSHPERERP